MHYVSILELYIVKIIFPNWKGMKHFDMCEVMTETIIGSARRNISPHSPMYSPIRLSVVDGLMALVPA